MSIGPDIENGPLARNGRGSTHAEIYFGWKLLEWHDGAWWHEAKVGRWMADDPVQWVGSPWPAARPPSEIKNGV
jgi:hypothetical protein